MFKSNRGTAREGIGHCSRATEVLPGRESDSEKLVSDWFVMNQNTVCVRHTGLAPLTYYITIITIIIIIIIN